MADNKLQTNQTNPTPPPSPEPQGFTILALVGVLGLVLVFLALGYWVITQDFGLIPRLLLGAAGISLAIFFWFNPGSFASVFSSKGLRYRSNAFILVAAVIGIVIVLNLLSTRFLLAQADLTSNQQFTLADQSQQIVSNLQQNVSVHAFFTPQDTNRDQAENLLRLYKSLSPRFSYEIINPLSDPIQSREYQVTQSGTTVFELDKDHREAVFSSTETDYTGAIIKLLNPTEHTVFFLTGHGEHTIVADSDQQATLSSYSTLSGSLVRERYKVDTLDLSKVADIPISGTTTLVIGGPQKPLADQELAKIDKFLDNGGRLMLLVDSVYQSRSLADGTATLASMNKLLARYGVSAADGVILDNVARQAGSDPSIIIVNSYPTTTIARNLSSLTTAFPLANAIYTDQPVVTDTNTTRTAIITSGDSSTLSYLTADGKGIDDTKNKPGPFNIAVSLDYGQAGVADVTPGRKHNRVVVFGDSDFATNQLIGNANLVNQDLFINSVNWLNEADQLSGVRAKASDVRYITLRQVDANVIFYGSVLVLPLVVLIAGAVIWWRRR